MRPHRSSTVTVIACAVALISLLVAARAALADPRATMQTGTGPFQVSAPTTGEWVIINTHTGRFERWVFTGERYTVEASSFGGDGFTSLRYVRVGRP